GLGMHNAGDDEANVSSEEGAHDSEASQPGHCPRSPQSFWPRDIGVEKRLPRLLFVGSGRGTILQILGDLVHLLRAVLHGLGCACPLLLRYTEGRKPVEEKPIELRK